MLTLSDFLQVPGEDKKYGGGALNYAYFFLCELPKMIFFSNVTLKNTQEHPYFLFFALTSINARSHCHFSLHPPPLQMTFGWPLKDFLTLLTKTTVPLFFCLLTTCVIVVDIGRKNAKTTRTCVCKFEVGSINQC